MGVIVHANDDHDANDEYALVSSGVVSNTIVASYNFCNDIILGSYDYLVDLTVSEQMAGPGWSYDAGTDTFTSPPEDFEAELEAAYMAVNTAIEASLAAYASCDSGQRSTAIGNVLSELAEEDEAELTLMYAVNDFMAVKYP